MWNLSRNQNGMAFYPQYVDDIIIIYDANCIGPETIVLTPTLEAKNKISFLDLIIIRKALQLETDVYRKPTRTNTTINCLSNHPMEHTLAAYRYYIERMLNLPLDRTPELREWQTILHKAPSNNFQTTLLHKLKQQIQHRLAKPPPSKNSESNTKWATFTFSSLHVQIITNLFKHTNVKIVFRCRNRIAQLTKPATGHNIQPHSIGGF